MLSIPMRDSFTLLDGVMWRTKADYGGYPSLLSERGQETFAIQCFPSPGSGHSLPGGCSLEVN